LRCRIRAAPGHHLERWSPFLGDGRSGRARTPPSPGKDLCSYGDPCGALQSLGRFLGSAHDGLLVTHSRGSAINVYFLIRP